MLVWAINWDKQGIEVLDKIKYQRKSEGSELEVRYNSLRFFMKVRIKFKYLSKEQSLKRILKKIEFFKKWYEKYFNINI